MAWRRLALVCVLFLFPPPGCAQAQPRRTGSQEIPHWLGSHKQFLLAGTALAVAAFADGYTTHHCLVAHRCRETNPIFGSYPSALRLWLEGGSFVASEEVALYFLDRWTKDSPNRFERNTVLFGAAIPAGAHAWAAWHNSQLKLNATDVESGFSRTSPASSRAKTGQPKLAPTCLTVAKSAPGGPRSRK